MKRLILLLIVLELGCNHPVAKNNIPLYKLIVSLQEKIAAMTGTGSPSFAIAYSESPFTFTKGTAITTITPTVSGTIKSCVANPTLPDGLSIDNVTCAISGTPTLESGKQSYSITASNSGGTTQATIHINVRICYDWGCFQDKGDGTVQFTGNAGTFGGNAYTAQSLTFLKCSQGQTWNVTTNSCDGTAGTYQYFSVNDNSCNSVGNEYSAWTLNGTGSSSAYTTCNSIGTYAGYTGWRVPAKNELKTLINCKNKTMPNDATTCESGNYPSLEVNNLFINYLTGSYYLTSSTCTYDNALATYIKFSTGHIFIIKM